MSNETKKLRKIPIIITKYNDGIYSGYRAEIADNYENYKPTLFGKINFEDLSFHFEIPKYFETKDIYQEIFTKKSEAMLAAKYVNEKKLNGICRIFSVK